MHVLRNEAISKLVSNRDNKKAQIERFFAEREGDALVLADNPYVKQAYKALDSAYKSNGGAAGGRFKGHTGGKYTAPAGYKSVHDRYFKTLDYYMVQYGYYDVFLMDAKNGDTVFTVTKEADFGLRARDVSANLDSVSPKS